MRGSLQQKSGSYYGVFRVDGKLKWTNLGISAVPGNKRKAEAALSDLVSQYNKNPRMFDKTPFAEYAKTWLERVKFDVDPVTFDGYRQYCEKHILPYFSPLHFNLQDVRVSDVEDYFRFKSVAGRLDGKSGGLSYRTLKLHSVVLHLIFEDAYRNGLIEENPCKFAQIPKNAKRSGKLTDFYSPEQCGNLLKAIAGTVLYDMVFLTFLYGLRRSELMGLRWNAVDFENNTISICHTVVVNETVVAKDKTKNEASNRIYPLIDDVRNILLRRKEEQESDRRRFVNGYNNSDYVFTKEDGSLYYPAYPSHALRKALVKRFFSFYREKNQIKRRAEGNQDGVYLRSDKS